MHGNNPLTRKHKIRENWLLFHLIIMLLNKPQRFRNPAFCIRNIGYRVLSTIPSWATIDPAALGMSKEPYLVPNIVGGEFTTTKSTMDIIHPMDRNANPIFKVPDTQIDEIEPFVNSLRRCPKSGMHNPLKNPERYVQYGEISRKVCCKLV